MDIKILVATHKPYWMPSDPVYVPIHVGAASKESIGFMGDDTGDNISLKNKNYCELTGLYWTWKNLDADYIGLVHYRRHFANKKLFCKKKERVISGAQIEKLLCSFDILLPRPRNYWIESNYSQYSHAHHDKDLDTTRQILAEDYPAYLDAWDRIMKKTIGHRFNMLIMKKTMLDQYCEWLFDILFKLEKRLDISSYSDNDARVFGFVSERLLDIWIEANHLRFCNIPYVFMEKQNWFIKIRNFIFRKIGVHL